MTKKHFIELADTIRANRELFTAKALDVLAGFCRGQNHNFMRNRWLDYIDGKCGPCGGAIKKEKVK